VRRWAAGWHAGSPRAVAASIEKRGRVRWLEPSAVDVVGEVEHRTLGVHAEGGGDQLRVDGVDQVGQPGAAGPSLG